MNHASALHRPADDATARIPHRPVARSASSANDPAPLVAHWARHADDVVQAQALRHRVFVQEMGARPAVLPGTPPGLDADRFDAHCQHLIVRTVASDDRPSRVVGTYRVLTPSGAADAGALYADSEFDLAPLERARPKLVELGRSCIDPDFRHGGVIMLLWSQLATMMQRNGLRWMIGCASVPMRDGGHVAASLWESLRHDAMAPADWRLTPRLPLPVDQLRCDLQVEPPALIKGYLRCGARLMGAPAWDPDFGTADLPLMLDLEALSPAYRKRFLGA
jgi:putative hemolysin